MIAALSHPDCRATADYNSAATWLGHVEAGRIGVKAEADPAIRARVLANERVICGRQRTPG